MTSGTIDAFRNTDTLLSRMGASCQYNETKIRDPRLQLRRSVIYLRFAVLKVAICLLTAEILSIPNKFLNRPQSNG